MNGLPSVSSDYGEARLVMRDDGWYVELEDFEGVHSVGPTTKENALTIMEEVRQAVRKVTN